MPFYRWKMIKKVMSLLNRSEMMRFRLLLVCTLFSVGLQSLGIGAIFPFMNLVLYPEGIEDSKILRIVYELLGFSQPLSFIIFFGLMLLVLIVVGNAASTLVVWLGSKFVWQVNHRLGSSLLERYLGKPYAYYLNQNTSELGKNVLSEVQELTLGFLMPLLSVIIKLLLSAGILLLLLLINPLATLIAVVFIGGAYLLIFNGFRRQLSRSGEKRLLMNTKRFQSVTEAMSGIKELKILGREAYFLNQFRDSSQKMADLRAKQEMISKLPRHLMEAVSFGGVVVMTLVMLVTRGHVQEAIPLISLYAFAGYRLMPSLQDAFNALTTLQFNIATVERIEQDLRTTVEEDDRVGCQGGEVEALPFQQSITFDQVSYVYPESADKVLREIDMTVHRHTSVALVGPSGSGKTTMADILLGLLTPTEGLIRVDGTPIVEENIRRWQRNLGYVPQSIYLSDDTIRHNIAFGIADHDIDEQAMQQAAQVANIHDFIVKMLPDQYETLVGEKGVRLSGGQKQRIGLARALYHDPDILILDEATSALDGKTEAGVIEAIEHLSHVKTVVIIAHRLSTVRHCDRIYLLEEGRMVAQGTFDALMETNALFQAMARGLENQDSREVGFSEPE